MSVSKAISASSTFFEILDAPSMRLTGLKGPQVSALNDITFKNVTFSYPSRPSAKVLHNINLCFPAGKVTALVGPSGCGKSTIVGLLERWYQISDQAAGDGLGPATPTLESEGQGEKSGGAGSATPPEPNGAITVGPHNIDDLDLRWWRSQIGLVQQEPFSFNASIYTNVSYGLVGSKWEHETEERKRNLVEGACKEAFASEFIERLPDVGYVTPSPAVSSYLRIYRAMILSLGRMESSSVEDSVNDSPLPGVSSANPLF